MFEGFIGALGFLLFWCIPIWAIIWFFKNKLVERGPGIKKQDKPYQPGLFDRLFDKIWDLPGYLIFLIFVAIIWTAVSAALCLFTLYIWCPIPPFSWIAPW